MIGKGVIRGLVGWMGVIGVWGEEEKGVRIEEVLEEGDGDRKRVKVDELGVEEGIEGIKVGKNEGVGCLEGSVCLR